MKQWHISPQTLAKRASVLALMCLCSLGWLNSGASAQPNQTRGSRTDAERERSLSALRLELEQLDSDFERVSAQADDVVGRVGRLRKAIEIQELRVKEAQAALAAAIEGVSEAERTLATVEAEGEAMRAQLEQRARRLYQLGRWGTVRVLFSLRRPADTHPSGRVVSQVAAGADGGGVEAGRDADGRTTAYAPEPLAGLRLLRAVVRQDARGLALLEANREAAAVAANDLERRKEDARSWLDEQRAVNARLSSRRREEQTALRALAQRQEQIEQQLAGTRTRHDRLNRLLEILGSEGPGGLGGLPIEEFKGALDWPVLGPLVRRFGPYRDAQYGTLVPHNGLTITTQFADGVRAVYPGRVVYAGQFRDVGLVVVLQHSREALTMYSGLASAAVGEGDIVSLGDQIGTASSELYFEIRAGKSAEDPLVWLSAAG